MIKITPTYNKWFHPFKWLNDRKKFKVMQKFYNGIDGKKFANILYKMQFDMMVFGKLKDCYCEDNEVCVQCDKELTREKRVEEAEQADKLHE